MAQNRKLVTDRDFQEAQDREVHVRVFRDDQIVDSGVVVVRFTETFVVTQSGVSDVSYHARNECEFFEMRKR